MTPLLKTLAAAALCLALAGPAAARSSVPIVNHPQVTWARPAGEALSLVQIRERIVAACQERGWRAEPGSAPDTLLATLVVRNKHTIRVNIAYRADTFDVTYAGSDNMNYAVKEPNPYAVGLGPAGQVDTRTEVIHPNYNRWVDLLIGTIRARLERSAP